MIEYNISLVNKDGKLIKTINLVKLFHSHYPEQKILNIKRIGNRSVLLTTTSDNKSLSVKVKGVGVERYTYHYANETDFLYNQFIAKTDIKYMKFQVVNPKLTNLNRQNIIVVDLPYQDFIGEPIGGCGAKELRAEKIYKQLTDTSVVSIEPISHINIFTDNSPIYLVFYYYKDNVDYVGKTLEDLIEKGDKVEILNTFKQVAKTMKVFLDSHIVVPKDKNILADINYNGLYNDIADTYIQKTDTKFHFFGTLYNLFRLAFYEHSNLYREPKFMYQIYKTFLNTFYTPPDFPKQENNKKEQKRKQRIERKVINELDEIKIAYMIANILQLKLPVARELKWFLEKKLGGKVSRYEVGDKLALASYWILNKYYHYNKSLAEMF